jgi:hypothetical protein
VPIETNTATITEATLSAINRLVIIIAFRMNAHDFTPSARSPQRAGRERVEPIQLESANPIRDADLPFLPAGGPERSTGVP